MKIAIDILQEEIKISSERLKTAYYLISSEPFVRERIKALQAAVKVLENKLKTKDISCDVCGSSDIIDAPPMGRNCNRCNPLN